MPEDYLMLFGRWLLIVGCAPLERVGTRSKKTRRRQMNHFDFQALGTKLLLERFSILVSLIIFAGS